MQGRMADTFRLADKIAGFKAKLATWARHANQGVFDMFSNLSSFLEEPAGLGELIHSHLTSLSAAFERYFLSSKDPRNGKGWMRDPLQNDDGRDQLPSKQDDQLHRENTTRGTLALQTLLPFPTSYLCKAIFSAMTATKTRVRSRPNVKNTLRVSLSPITPGMMYLWPANRPRGLTDTDLSKLMTLIFVKWSYLMFSFIVSWF